MVPCECEVPGNVTGPAQLPGSLIPRLLSSAGARDLGLPMGREECEQAFAHQHARTIRRHVHLDLAIHVDDRVRVGRFQYLPVLGNNGGVPVDQLLGGTILFPIVAKQDLHQLDRTIIDGSCRIENDVAQPGRIFDVQRTAEGHEPGVAHMSRL